MARNESLQSASGTANTTDVDVVSSALPTGAATSANQTNYVNDPMLTIAHGSNPLISSCIWVNKFGENPSSAIATQEDLWDGGGTYPYPATALITDLKQATDQETMRGATIEAQGLDTSWDLVVQTKALDASNTTTKVALATPLIRVMRMKVLANVVGDQNINAMDTGAGTAIYATITAGMNQTLMALYTVPNGYTAYVTHIYSSVTRSTSQDPTGTDIRLWAADRANNYDFQLKYAIGLPGSASPHIQPFRPYNRFTQKTDLKLTSTCGDKAGYVHGGFDLILVANL